MMVVIASQSHYGVVNLNDAAVATVVSGSWVNKKNKLLSKAHCVIGHINKHCNL